MFSVAPILFCFARAFLRAPLRLLGLGLLLRLFRP